MPYTLISQVPNYEIIDQGAIVLGHGRGSFLVPSNPAVENVLVFLREFIDPLSSAYEHGRDASQYPNCFLPNCLQWQGEDDVKKAKSSGGYKIIYDIGSPGRILEWVRVKYAQ